MRKKIIITIASVVLVLFVSSILTFLPSLTGSTKSVMIKKALEEALISKEIPDYNLIKDPQKVILSLDNIDKSMIPTLSGIEIIPIEQDKLQEKADKEGDFLYLRFTEFEIGHFNSTVSLDNGWIQHKGAEGMYLSGGGFKLKYHNILGFWREDPMKQSWIS